MKKAAISLTIILLILLALFIIFLTPQFTGRAIENQENNENQYTYTKAICNSTNFCQDNEITCKNNELISVSPISGAAIQFDQDWEDPRDEEVINTLC